MKKIIFLFSLILSLNCISRELILDIHFIPPSLGKIDKTFENGKVLYTRLKDGRQVLSDSSKLMKRIESFNGISIGDYVMTEKDGKYHAGKVEFIFENGYIVFNNQYGHSIISMSADVSKEIKTNSKYDFLSISSLITTEYYPQIQSKMKRRAISVLKKQQKMEAIDRSEEKSMYSMALDKAFKLITTTDDDNHGNIISRCLPCLPINIDPWFSLKREILHSPAQTQLKWITPTLDVILDKYKIPLLLKHGSRSWLITYGKITGNFNFNYFETLFGNREIEEIVQGYIKEKLKNVIAE